MKKSENRIEAANSAARSVIICVNPHAGATASDSDVGKLEKLLKSRDFEPFVLTDLEEIKRRVSECSSAGKLRSVVAAGGDGTVSLLINALPDVCFSILPLGTENLLAKHLSLEPDPECLAEIIEEGISVRLDAGVANGILFTVMATCGFDAEVVRRVHKDREGHIQKMSYAKPIFKSIRKYPFPTLKVRTDDGTPQNVKWAFIFNVPRYAMHLPIVEEASGLDGQLDLLTFRGGNLFNGVMYFFGVLLKRHRSWKDTNVIRGQRFVIESDEMVPYQIDGDPGGQLPLTVEIAPARIRMMVSSKWLVEQGLSRKHSSSLQTES